MHGLRPVVGTVPDTMIDIEPASADPRRGDALLSTSAYIRSIPKTCPDCGGTQSRSQTGLAKEARCVQCDGLMNGQTVFYKYLGGLILAVFLVIAGAWVVLA